MNYTKLAELLFPYITATPQDFEEKYPSRCLAEGARVTRFAPSPTGFMHIGGLFAALVSERVAHQSGGIFYLRIEDTDKKRELEGGIEEIVSSLGRFGIVFDEGAISAASEKGEYGPYKQSDRVNIYKTYAKDLVAKGLAYPCFCSEEDIANIRLQQEEKKLVTGYYGEWTKCRELPLDKIEELIGARMPFVLRLRSPGDPEKRMVYSDLIKGNVEILENNIDEVLLKSDGIPTYHFAHAIDDHLMRTTHVIRGDEWLSSLPKHLQLFNILGFKPPKYAHISPIMKLEGDSKRKLSKRKDPEAAVTFYHSQGYPIAAVTEYLLTLANSNYEDWRRANPTADNTQFKLDLKKMSVSGALFDIIKLTDISKNVISEMDAATVYALTHSWAKDYDSELLSLMDKYPQYTKDIFAIGRSVPKPRKDIAKWSEVKDYISFFYEELYKNDYPYPENINNADIKAIITQYIKRYDEGDDNNAWFEKLKVLSEELGFSSDVKAYKKNPESFKGHVGDVSMVLRVAVTGRQNTPDLHTIMQTLTKATVLKRLNDYIGG